MVSRQPQAKVREMMAVLERLGGGTHVERLKHVIGRKVCRALVKAWDVLGADLRTVSRRRNDQGIRGKFFSIEGQCQASLKSPSQCVKKCRWSCIMIHFYMPVLRSKSEI